MCIVHYILQPLLYSRNSSLEAQPQSPQLCALLHNMKLHKYNLLNCTDLHRNVHCSSQDEFAPLKGFALPLYNI